MIPRRTFNKATVALALTEARSSSFLNEAQLGKYTLLALPASLENTPSARIWNPISKEETWDAIKALGIYDDASEHWWIKLQGYEINGVNVTPLMYAAGGTKQFYSASAVVYCEDGKVTHVTKDKAAFATKIPDVMFTFKVKTLCPHRLITKKDLEPFIEVL